MGGSWLGRPGPEPVMSASPNGPVRIPVARQIQGRTAWARRSLSPRPRQPGLCLLTSCRREASPSTDLVAYRPPLAMRTTKAARTKRDTTRVVMTKARCPRDSPYPAGRRVKRYAAKAAEIAAMSTEANDPMPPSNATTTMATTSAAMAAPCSKVGAATRRAPGPPRIQIGTSSAVAAVTKVNRTTQSSIR